MDTGAGQPDAGVADGQHWSMSPVQEGRPDRIGSLFDGACPTCRNAGYRADRTLTLTVTVRRSRYGHAAGPARRGRRRPEESVQTDQRGLRGQCDPRGSATLVRGPSCFSLLRPRNACDSTARVARSARRGGHLVQQPCCTPRPWRRGLHEGLDQHGVDQRTGPCRSPTTMAGLPHTGFAERLRLTGSRVTVR